MENFKENYWYERIARRGDLVVALAHLTKPNEFRVNEILSNNKLASFEQIINDVNSSAVENLIKILKDGVIRGSGKKGFIIGTNTATCFQEVPSKDILANIELEYERLKRAYDKGYLNKFRLRYTGVGMYFDKRLIFKAGGRPVIYDNTEETRNMLSPDEHWRLVNLNLKSINNITDWTHEREWRIKGDYQFDLEQVFKHYLSSLIFPTRKSFDYFYELIQNEFPQNWFKSFSVNELKEYTPNVIILEEFAPIQLEKRLNQLKAKQFEGIFEDG